MAINAKSGQLGNNTKAVPPWRNCFFVGGMDVHLLESVNRFIWGLPALVLILGVGIYLTIRTKFAQFRLFPAALRSFLLKLKPGMSDGAGITQFEALCTALAATVGTGNIAGVAGAIAIGGPGAIFWMWVCAVFGMVTKFAEAALAVRYRQSSGDGSYIGGPMYMIEYGIGKRWRFLASAYAFMGVIAAFGIGNATQINAVVDGINSIIVMSGGNPTPQGNAVVGAAFAGIMIAVLLGGAKRVGKLSQAMVPAVAVGYIILCAGVLAIRANMIPQAFRMILKGAFSPSAVTGGIVGSSFAALRVGAARGVFTNEAGMGTASIAHASADVRHPTEQGLMGIMEVFLDTIVICTMTALAILCCNETVVYGIDEGFALTERAFSLIYGDWVRIPLTIFLCFFAFATMLGWGLYGLRCAEYLFGSDVWRWFVLLQAGVIVVSTLLKTSTVWLLSETVNGLMAIPNLIALAILSPELTQLVTQYKKRAP